jgi:hypothetical protein
MQVILHLNRKLVHGQDFSLCNSWIMYYLQSRSTYFIGHETRGDSQVSYIW